MPRLRRQSPGTDQRRDAAVEMCQLQQLCPHPSFVPIELCYRRSQNAVETETIIENYPVSILLRFSASAQRQILQNGDKTFRIIYWHHDWHPTMAESIKCIATFLSEMSQVQASSAKAAVAAPILDTHFSHGLIQAMIYLYTVKAFELNGAYGQDQWIRRWITCWIDNHNVLPQELVCASRLFSEDETDKTIKKLIVNKAVNTWDTDTLCFDRNQTNWYKETRSQDASLWYSVAKQTDMKRGGGAFEALWAHVTRNRNVLSRKRGKKDGANSKATKDAEAFPSHIDKLSKISRKKHFHILHETLKDVMPVLSPEQEAKRLLEDGRWNVTVRFNRHGEKIKRWERNP